MHERVVALEKEVEKLDRDELRLFADRFAEVLDRSGLEFFAEWWSERAEELWDQQIAADAAAGKLDFLAAGARADKKAGRLTDLLDGPPTSNQ